MHQAKPAETGAGEVAENTRSDFEAFYRGWDAFSRGRSGEPPALMSPDEKRLFTKGWRAAREVRSATEKGEEAWQ